MTLAYPIGIFAGLVSGLIWAYVVTTIAYAKWGFLAAVAGLALSAPTAPIAPLVAWYFFPESLMSWYYGATAIAIAANVWHRLTRPRIVDEFGRSV